MDIEELFKDQKKRIYMFGSYKYSIILLLIFPLYLSILLPSALICILYFVFSKLFIAREKSNIKLKIIDDIK